MGFKQQVTDLTALGAATVKTLIDTLTVPQGVTKLVAVSSSVIGADTVTSTEAISGIVELESDDIPMVPAQFLTDQITILTSGAVAFSPKQWPCDIPVTPGSRIRCYITNDDTSTGTIKGRVQLTYA